MKPDIHSYIRPGAHAHLVGIGGVSMSPLAEVLHNAGVVISGSDLHESAAVSHLRSLGIPVVIGHRGESVQGAGCVIRTAAVHDDNPEIAAQLDMEPARVRELIQLAQDPISLETPVGEEEDAHLEDFIQDDEAGVPADEAGRQLLRRELMNVLKSLTPREERVIALRFGLEDGRARTLEELGREFNVTRERVRQIEAKALRKLRHPSRAKRLRDYLDE